MTALRPDIIGFQEVDLRLDQGNWLCRRCNDLIKSSGGPEYRIHHMANPRENVALEALAIMTRLPVQAHEGHDYLIRNRVAHRVRVDVGGAALDFWNTHFHHLQNAEGNELRERQAQMLLRWLRRAGDGVPSVAGGDFNALPGTKSVSILRGSLRSAHQVAHGTEPERTYWTPLANEIRGDQPPEGLVIDYIFVSPEVGVLDAGLAFDRPHPEDGALYPSDHFGLAARLSIG